MTSNENFAGIEIISIDPTREYVSDEEESPSSFQDCDNDSGPDNAQFTDPETLSQDNSCENVKRCYEDDIIKFREAWKLSGNKRIHKKSFSVPHSPQHFSLGLTAVSLDDLDVITGFDLPNSELLSSSGWSSTSNFQSSPKLSQKKDCHLSNAYSQQDDNFEVISPRKPRSAQQCLDIKVSKIDESDDCKHNHVVTKASVHRQSKKYSNVTNNHDTIKSSDDCSDVEMNNIGDNSKTDPTWHPLKTKRIGKCNKSSDKQKTIKNDKATKAKSTNVTFPTVKSQTKLEPVIKQKAPLLKTKSPNRIVESKGQFSKDRSPMVVSRSLF